MKRILILGIEGFIGRSLRCFIEKNFSQYEAYGLDISLSKPSARCFKGDISDIKLLTKIIKRVSPHYLFHLAGGHSKTEGLPGLFSANVLTTYYLLELMLILKRPRPRIIIPGSAAEYGQVLRKDMPVKESQILKPVNFYGLAKMYQTTLALTYCKKGLDIAVGRIFNITGHGTPLWLNAGKFAYEISLIEKSRKNAVIETMDLSSRRDYIDIQDVCSGLLAIARAGKKGNVYNICLEKSYKTENILNYLLKLSNLKRVKIKMRRHFDSEIKTIIGSNKKLKTDTGWRPKIPIQESLRNTLDYYRRLRDSTL